MHAIALAKAKQLEIIPKFAALPKSGRLAVIGKNLFENLDAATT